MLLPITALYAALLTLVALVLQQLIGRERLRTGVSLGDGGHPELLAAMRRQANFVEQVPLALILLAALELNGATAGWLHGLGAVLLIARIAHPIGIDAADFRHLPRLIGAVATLVVMLLAAGKLLWMTLA